ncbi:hypothetical protein C8T65DRAFT_672194 [Cerioporus squamosus]|nr:hypothetical protein C8T65DRAFT_672194 [Cerioporus squamosus]
MSSTRYVRVHAAKVAMSPSKRTVSWVRVVFAASSQAVKRAHRLVRHRRTRDGDEEGVVVGGETRAALLGDFPYIRGCPQPGAASTRQHARNRHSRASELGEPRFRRHLASECPTRAPYATCVRHRSHVSPQASRRSSQRLLYSRQLPKSCTRSRKPAVSQVRVIVAAELPQAHKFHRAPGQRIASSERREPAARVAVSQSADSARSLGTCPGSSAMFRCSSSCPCSARGH